MRRLLFSIQELVLAGAAWACCEVAMFVHLDILPLTLLMRVAFVYFIVLEQLMIWGDKSEAGE